MFCTSLALEYFDATRRENGSLESHAIDARQQRILLQDLHVKEIPQLEVEYMYAGVDRRLWICGDEQRVHAPGAPWHRGRYWLLVGSVALAVAAALAGLAYVLLV